MALFRDNGWKTVGETYSEFQIEAVLNELGIEVKGGTEQVFLASCPFHYNPGSPAFAVNKESGLFYCHNPACALKGTLAQLVERVTNKSGLEAKKLINGFYTDIDYVALIEKELEPVVFEPFSQETLDRLKDNLNDSKGERYMNGRGFNSTTLEYFGIGYSKKKDSVIVPVHTDSGIPIGFVARSTTGKNFQNSKGLPKSKTAFNLHRAKREGGVGIVCESSFDVMRIHQAGYPNAIALLGGSLSRYTVEQLERYFSTIVIMTDNDEPGRKLGESIEEKVRRKILWAADGPDVYPHGAKDACDLTETEIRKVLSNAVGGLEYRSWYN